MADITLDQARHWDQTDPLRGWRGQFDLPPGVIYLDGNSLGPPPRATLAHLTGVARDEWGRGLIRSWDEGGWMRAPTRIGGKIAPLIGAGADEVIVADSTSVNLFKLLGAAARLRPGRTGLLLEDANFPTDRHVAQSAASLLGLRLRAVPAEALPGAIGKDTAAVLLCHVHYRSGARHDMKALTQAAQQAGALTIWDLSHSAGAVPVDLNAAGADLATGCGYKFLNGGPGAPAFLFVARALQAQARSPLQGWIGHANPFGFSDIYEPAPGIARFLTGTPSILGLAALEAGVDNFAAALAAHSNVLFDKSARMFDLFASLAAARCPSLHLLTPRDPTHRGSHISFRQRNAAVLMRALSAQNIIGDYRPPDVMRFGLTPLYSSFEDIWRTVDAVAKQVRSASF